MVEVGLVKFATVALRVGQRVLLSYHSKFSKYGFTQPQLLAMLCLMRYEDWTFREAEVRLAEHRELRRALGVDRVPDYTALYRFLRQLAERLLEQLLSAVVQRLLPRPRLQTTVAVKATGLAPGAISPFFVRRVQDREPGFTWRHWLQWPMIVDLNHHLILAQTARRGPTNGCATVRPLVSAARVRAPMRRVLADAECDCERNPQYIRPVLHAQSVIPAKRDGPPGRFTGWGRRCVRSVLPRCVASAP